MATLPTIYDYGDTPLVTATFVDINDAAADPTAVTFKVIKPDNTTTTTTHPDAAIVNTAVGTWTYQMDTLDAEGSWAVRVEGTGAVAAAGEKRFIVRSTEFY